jgi:hypothetical protein
VSAAGPAPTVAPRPIDERVIANADPFHLRGIPGLREAADDVLRRISSVVEVAYVDVGSLVIGGRDRCALVVLADGRAETVCHQDHAHHPVRRVVDAATGPRLLALLPGDRPGLHVRAHTPLTLLQLRRPDYDAIAREHPEVAARLRRATAHRGHR